MSEALKESLVDYDAATGRMRSTPQQIFIETSSRCNLKCVHCPKDFGSDLGHPQLDLPLETINRLDPWLRAARFVNLNMVGEPMVSPHFDKIVEICGAGDAEVSFNSNGLLLTDARCQLLIEHGVHSIAVSIDGTDSMMPIRGVPHTAVIDRLVQLDEAKRRAGSETPHIALAYVMMRRNALELPKLLRQLLPRVHLHAIHIQPLVIYYETLRGENIYDCDVANDAVEEAREVANQHGVLFSVFRSSSSEDERHEDKAHDEGLGQLGQHSEEFGCIDPFYEIKVRSTGEIMACSYGQMPGFHVHRMELDEIWNHEWYRGLRQRLYSKEFSGPCEGCPYVHGCSTNQLDALRPGIHHSQEERFFRGGYRRRKPQPERYPSHGFDP